MDMLEEEKVRKTSGECQRGQLEFDLGGGGRTKQRWCDIINSDLRWLDLDGADAEDRVRWRGLVELGIEQKPATRARPRQ